MKVIKKGNLPENKTYRVICSYCKSELEFEQREGKITYDQREGDYITVTCPVCQKLVYKDLKG